MINFFRDVSFSADDRLSRRSMFLLGLDDVEPVVVFDDVLWWVLWMKDGECSPDPMALLGNSNES